jgi:hypothetical protein
MRMSRKEILEERTRLVCVLNPARTDRALAITNFL